MQQFIKSLASKAFEINNLRGIFLDIQVKIASNNFNSKKIKYEN